MKKRKLKQFFKENWGWFAFVIWLLLVSGTISTVMATILYSLDISIWINLSLVAICVLYTIAGLVLISKSADKDEKRRAEAKNKRLQELKVQDKYYIDLVDRHVKETLSKFKDTSLSVDIDTSLEYLISFSNKVNWICNTRIIGKPDSFIIASCLMYSLISHPVITVNKSDDSEYLQSIRFSINMDVVMSCVFEIISEPSTYFEDNGIWVEEKHPKVNISVPNGLIKNSELYQRILNSIYRDELSDSRTSIMQFSNLLHLIYLNCQ